MNWLGSRTGDTASPVPSAQYKRFVADGSCPLLANRPSRIELLDQEFIEKPPPLYSGEEKGLEAQAQVKFFTPDSNWTWYASEFHGEDIFSGLVSVFEVELGYY
jgi:hypothetical protein